MENFVVGKKEGKKERKKERTKERKKERESANLPAQTAQYDTWTYQKNDRPREIQRSK